MWQKILTSLLSYVIGKLIGLITNKWDEYQEDQEKKEEIKVKVKAIKNAKTKEEFRVAIRDLSI